MVRYLVCEFRFPLCFGFGYETNIAFIAVIFGGIGSFSGAVAGELILGFIEVSLRTYLPESALPFRDAIGYFIVTLVLLRWPDGLISIHRRE